MTFDTTELADIESALRFARRGIERLLSAGYPERVNDSDRRLIAQRERLDKLVQKITGRALKETG